jgi:ketosteroid isomerase-like protein
MFPPSLNMMLLVPKHQPVERLHRATANGWLSLQKSTPAQSKRCTSSREEDMDSTITEAEVRAIFKGLESGDGASFFEHVDDEVDWTVEGTHPLAGHYRSKADFRAGTFDKLGKVLPEGAQLVVEHLLVKGDDAVVELHSLATARSGLRFDNRYCWVVHFKDKVIDRVRAYLDSAMVARLFEQNPI